MDVDGWMDRLIDRWMGGMTDWLIDGLMGERMERRWVAAG